MGGCCSAEARIPRSRTGEGDWCANCGMRWGENPQSPHATCHGSKGDDSRRRATPYSEKDSRARLTGICIKVRLEVSATPRSTTSFRHNRTFKCILGGSALRTAGSLMKLAFGSTRLKELDCRNRSSQSPVQGSRSGTPARELRQRAGSDCYAAFNFRTSAAVQALKSHRTDSSCAQSQYRRPSGTSARLTITNTIELTKGTLADNESTHAKSPRWEHGCFGSDGRSLSDIRRLSRCWYREPVCANLGNRSSAANFQRCRIDGTPRWFHQNHVLKSIDGKNGSKSTTGNTDPTRYRTSDLHVRRL
jgi:hypothetical protein